MQVSKENRFKCLLLQRKQLIPSEFHFRLDQIFHDVAYKAKDRSDLLAGIDEFLDQVTVLPPGEWDPSIRIEPPKNVPSQVHRFFSATNPGIKRVHLS